MSKLNCWEHKKCGREPYGAKSKEFGVCPASTEARLDSVHEGKNGGRSCWIVAGSLCGGEIQGSFAQKFHNCRDCDFYGAVKKEERGGFELSAVLLNRVKTPRAASPSAGPSLSMLTK